MPHLLKGILIGFALAAAVGPVCLLCLRRALTNGRLIGFVSGLGVATADALYTGVASVGVSAITYALDHYHTAFELFAGTVLIVLGVFTYRTPAPSVAKRTEKTPSLTGAFFSTFALTIAHPATLLALTFILAAMGVTPGSDTLGDTALLSLGVLLGSSVWWLALSSWAGWFGRKLSPATLVRINHYSGIAIIVFGLWQFGTLVWPLLARRL